MEWHGWVGGELVTGCSADVMGWHGIVKKKRISDNGNDEEMKFESRGRHIQSIIYFIQLFIYFIMRSILITSTNQINISIKSCSS